MSDEIHWGESKKKRGLDGYTKPGTKAEPTPKLNLNHWIRNPRFKQRTP